jgi:hypothetical protein
MAWQVGQKLDFSHPHPSENCLVFLPPEPSISIPHYSSSKYVQHSLPPPPPQKEKKLYTWFYLPSLYENYCSKESFPVVSV